jgi:hypothetical protein
MSTASRTIGPPAVAALLFVGAAGFSVHRQQRAPDEGSSGGGAVALRR